MDLAKRAYVMRRLDRHERQLSLWLVRVVAFLFVFENTALARALHARIAHFVAKISACVLDFIAMRATWSPGYQRRMSLRRVAGCASAQRGALSARAKPRGLLGGALRRALKAKTLKGRAEALLRVLQKRDQWVTYLARRITRGQTRIYSAHSRVAKTLRACRAEAPRAQAVFTQGAFEEDLRAALNLVGFIAEFAPALLTQGRPHVLA